MVSEYSPAAGKVVQEADAAARAERHAFLVDELRARAWQAFGCQRDDHVVLVAVGGAHRLAFAIAHGLLRHLARGGEVLVQVRRRHLQMRGVVVETFLALVGGSSAVTSASRPMQIAHGIGVFALVETAQRHAARRRR